jgi:hypothetical protein
MRAGKKEDTTMSESIKQAQKLLDEAKDLSVYKALVRKFAAYADNAPATGYGILFNKLITQGIKAMPSDPQALVILRYIVSIKSDGDALHRLINTRFSDLPPTVRPRIKDPKSRQQKIANWSRGKEIHDRIRALIDWDGKGGSTGWCDIDGKSVQVVEIGEEDEKA